MPSIGAVKVVEEEHPLKQGLKLIGYPIITRYNSVEEEHPLKQGLKLYEIIH